MCTLLFWSFVNQHFLWTLIVYTWAQVVCTCGLKKYYYSQKLPLSSTNSPDTDFASCKGQAVQQKTSFKQYLWQFIQKTCMSYCHVYLIKLGSRQLGPSWCKLFGLVGTLSLNLGTWTQPAFLVQPAPHLVQADWLVQAGATNVTRSLVVSNPIGAAGS